MSHLKLIDLDSRKEYFVPTAYLPGFKNEDKLCIFALRNRLSRAVWTETSTGKPIFQKLF